MPNIYYNGVKYNTIEFIEFCNISSRGIDPNGFSEQDVEDLVESMGAEIK